MGVPKRKVSKSRKGNRHSHIRVPAVAVRLCPQCRKPYRPYRACTFCGYYAGVGSRVLWVRRRKGEEETRSAQR
ncbi:MAG: 50S ribosomal protein L32 [Armatimonadetes bacterium]|nr:50S ribosomal protein L32 [Armatimonadota bacterium]MDW8122998.1 50S ribosomal protein L32 [Armatimonadota bacterium]